MRLGDRYVHAVHNQFALTLIFKKLNYLTTRRHKYRELILKMILSIDVIEEKLDQGEDGETSVSVHAEPGVYQDHHPALCLAAIHCYHLSRLVCGPMLTAVSTVRELTSVRPGFSTTNPISRLASVATRMLRACSELGPCAAELTTRSLLGNSQAGAKPGTPETEIS